MNVSKSQYREFCEAEDKMPVFSMAWWLDAICGEDGWDVLLYHENDEIIAAMPYYISKILFFKINKMPVLTQSLGIYLKYPPDLESGKKLSLEKTVYTNFISKLPRADAHFINFHYSVTNWLPFFWNGFRQTTRYTYVIEDISDVTIVYNNFSRAKKKNIKRASEILKVKFDLSAQEFYDHHKYTMGQKGQKVLYTYRVFERLYRSSYENRSGRTIYAIDSDDNIHSAIFCVWDNNSAYDLISTIDDKFKNSGSASLLVQELIKYLSGKVNKFDFEGSMFESVENSFRQFGTVQKPYHRIYRIDNILLRFVYQFILNQV
ncbi:MAG: hypothetical protein K8R35_07155 [Bacteroidales bacterium]|nr:hypothetical protein [Bacteroidales bacterium]